MPSREERRAERSARIAARRLRVQARRERVQARREAAEREVGLRRIEYRTTEVGAPPKRVALTHFGKAIRDETGVLSIEIRRTEKVESSWVHSIHLVWLREVNEIRLGVTFLDGYTCVYDGSGPADFAAMLAAPSKGKHVWAHWYGVDRRVISKHTRTHLGQLGMPV